MYSYFGIYENLHPGLRWVSDDRKFQVVKLQQSTTSGSPGPAATVVRPDPDGVLEATGGSKLPSLDEVKGSVVCWAVENWQARRYEADADAKVCGYLKCCKNMLFAKR